MLYIIILYIIIYIYHYISIVHLVLWDLSPNTGAPTPPDFSQGPRHVAAPPSPWFPSARPGAAVAVASSAARRRRTPRAQGPAPERRRWRPTQGPMVRWENVGGSKVVQLS